MLEWLVTGPWSALGGWTIIIVGAICLAGAWEAFRARR